MIALATLLGAMAAAVGYWLILGRLLNRKPRHAVTPPLRQLNVTLTITSDDFARQMENAARAMRTWSKAFHEVHGLSDQ